MKKVANNRHLARAEWLFLLVFGLLGAAAPLRAQTLPPELAQAWPAARPGGQHLMRFFGLSIYDIQLWVAPGFRPGQDVDLALSLTYRRSLSGAAIAQRSLDEMARQGPIAPAQAQAWLEAMTRLFPDVGAGDRLTGHYRVGQGVQFWFNGQPRGGVSDADFARRFFDIWLGPQTSEPALRAALLAPWLGTASAAAP